MKTTSKRINVLVDWGKSFVDPNGSFYCGTTESQKDNAVRIGKDSDLVIYFSDVHTRGSSEFLINGGLYPAHNLVKKDWFDMKSLGIEEGKSVSPELTDKLQDMVKDRKSGLIVPRHVFFQDYDVKNDNARQDNKSYRPAFTFQDVEETFGAKKLDSREFLDGKINYVINAKHMFNGAGLQSTEWLGKIPGIPDLEMNALTLLKEKYGQGKDLQFDITGVVMGICIYQTATNIRQIFPKANVNVIADACTHLIYEPLGIEDEKTGNYVAKKMCQQVGVNYLTTKEFFGGD